MTIELAGIVDPKGVTTFKSDLIQTKRALLFIFSPISDTLPYSSFSNPVPLRVDVSYFFLFPMSDLAYLIHSLNCSAVSFTFLGGNILFLPYFQKFNLLLLIIERYKSCKLIT